MNLQSYLNESYGKTPFLGIVRTLFDKCKPYLINMAKTGHAAELYSGRGDNRDMFIRKVRTDRSPMDTPVDVQNEFDELFYKKFRWRPRSNSIFVTSKRSTADSYGRIYMIFPVGGYKYLWHPKIKDLWTEIENSDAVEFYKGNNVEPDRYERENTYYDFYNDYKEEFERKNTEPEESDFEDEEGEVDDAAYEQAHEDWENDKEDYATEKANDAILDWEEEWMSNVKNNAYMYFEDLVAGYTDKDLVGAIKWQGEIMLGCDQVIGVSYYSYETYLDEFIRWYHWKKVPTQSDIEEFAKKNFTKLRKPEADVRKVLNIDNGVSIR